MEEKILMYKIRPRGNDLDWCIDYPENLPIHLSVPNEEWEINTVEMTKKDIDELEEFTGW